MNDVTTVTHLNKEGAYVTYIKQRVNKNKNFLCAITGPTGSGKTYSALSLAEDIDPNFTEDNIVFSLDEFILLINEGELRSGSVIVFEEAGVAMNNRKWQSFENNMIQFILQTFRHKNYIVIFTAPDFGFIDSASRKLMHAHFMTVGIDFESSLCNIKPYLIQINQRTGKLYYKFLKVNMQGEGQCKLNKIGISLPSKDLLKKYEERKSNFTSKLNNDIQEKMMAKLQEKRASKIAQDVRNEKLVNIRKLRGEKKPWKHIADMYGTTDNAIRQWYNREEANN